MYDASPAGKQKIYGLVQEETLPAVYKRTADWLRDPLDLFFGCDRRNEA